MRVQHIICITEYLEGMAGPDRPMAAGARTPGQPCCQVVAGAGARRRRREFAKWLRMAADDDDSSPSAMAA